MTIQTIEDLLKFVDTNFNKLSNEQYLELIENNFEQLETDLQTLKASERVKAIIELSKFILPTLKATEMSLSNETKFQAIEIELK
jgi:hypothetical protein